MLIVSVEVNDFEMHFILKRATLWTTIVNTVSVKNLSFYLITYSLHWYTGSTGDCPLHSTEEPLCSGVPGAPETSLLHVHREPPPQHHCPRRFPQHLHHGNRQPQGLHCLRGQWGMCILLSHREGEVVLN